MTYAVEIYDANDLSLNLVNMKEPGVKSPEVIERDESDD